MTSMDIPGWEHFFHEADIGVRGYGASCAQAFEQTALAMTAVITSPDLIEAREAVALELSCPDLELLLVDWLNALIYEMATRHMLFSRFQVRLEGERLSGQAWGERVALERHQPAVEIKGATYTSLAVYQTAEGAWVAQCVVDV